MAEITIRLDGLRDALKDIDQEAEAFLGKVDRRIKVAGVRIEAYAKALAPVDTGWLRRNIRNDMSAPFLEAIVTAQTSQKERDDYASYQELGTSRNRAQPYMRPASERALKQLTDEVKRL